MIKKELKIFECAYCSQRYDNAEDCAKCEAKHEEILNAEIQRFQAFRTELNDIEVLKHKRPVIQEVEEVDTGEVDGDGQPIMEEKIVEKVGQLQIKHCSKCLRLIHQNSFYVKAFNYILCLDCAVPLLRIFSKNYMTFRTQFANQLHAYNPHAYGMINDCDEKLILSSVCDHNC